MIQLKSILFLKFQITGTFNMIYKISLKLTNNYLLSILMK